MDLLHASFLSLVFLPLLLLSSPTTSDKVQYFINCGSSANATTTDGRTFIGDMKPAGFHLHGRRSKSIKNSNQSAESLYQTARVFRKPSTYVIDSLQTGTYILRLHFYAFSNSRILADSQFNVSASEHMLLPDFGVGRNATNSLVLKEFFININTTGKLQISFVPNPTAFVNAIEILSTNSNITEDAGPHVTPAGDMGVYKGPKNRVLETVYRINVGGNEFKSPDDLWRIWMPDDPYLNNTGDAQNATPHQTRIQFDSAPTDDYAPESVYQTAKVLKQNASYLTWQFNVSKGATHLVRLHFCDIISLALGPNVFNLYIYAKLVQVINASDAVLHLADPFYKDYIVESDDVDLISITLGSSYKSYLFLNGLEIMQVKNGTAPKYDYSSRSGLIIGLVIGAGVLVIAILLALVLFYQIKRKAKVVNAFEWAMVPLYGATSSRNRTSERSSSHASNFQNLHLGLKIPFIEVQQVTNNFDASLMIGEGGFGKVYKGTLKDGRKVAVKRSNPDHGQGLTEFQTEITVLSKIRHRHLVSLIGYCYEGDEMVLVYEFMEKGTLREYLYDSSGSPISSNGVGLSWRQRLEVCIGAAKGLHYLHAGAERGIIHRDVKSTNILLDERYVAKVADFGLSRLGHLEETHVSTAVKGTFGYLDPEYFKCLQLTEKSDVYSFGVVLLEVLCARKVIDKSLPKEQVNLADWAMVCHELGQLETIIDPSLVGEIDVNSLKKFSETAAKCLKEYAVDRPPMSDVLWDLEYALQLQKAADEKQMPGDSMTGASLTLQLPAGQCSQSFADEESNLMLTYTSTGEVFSQLMFDDDTGR